MDVFSFVIGLGTGILLAIPLTLAMIARATRRVRRLEQRTRSAQRLAELGTLTGGLAHEIKNPLSTVGLNIQLLREDLQQIASRVTQQPEVQEQLGRTLRRFDSLSRETDRVRDILEDFLRFAGRVKLHRARTDVNSLIDELVDFFTPQAQAAAVRIRTQASPQPATAWVDAGLFKQAMLNILLNGVQAMAQTRQSGRPHGGCNELFIRTERGRAGGQDEIRVHVTDTGPGIAADKLDKIFHPYFSTKKGGTGLGLPTARRIVEEHGGHIAVHSEPGRGTDFTICLPAHEPADLSGDDEK